MLCISLRGPTLQEAERQLAEALPLADLIEWRLDLFDDPRAIKTLHPVCPIPQIFTLRNGSEELLKELVELKPDYVDLEHPVPVPEGVKVIRSYHNYEETPENLEAILAELRQHPATYYKIATKAHTTSDALRLLNLGGDDVLAMGMGEEGVCTRILAPLFGQPFVYAALSDAEKTAPGQLTAQTLQELYHHRTLTPSSALYGLIGDPVSQSIGHHFHNAYMREQNALYVKLLIQPNELAPFIKKAPELGFRGLSVTIPHKETILSLLDEVTPHAQAIGAVNTVTFRDEKAIGSNTDSEGALDALEAVEKVQGKRVILIGAGGAARAVAYEALQRGASLLILNRTPERAQGLAKEFSCDWMPLAEWTGSQYDILINTTSNQDPVAPELIVPNCVAMDLSITPEITTFLKIASENGCHTVSGREMFHRQALLQAKTWGFGSDQTPHR